MKRGACCVLESTRSPDLPCLDLPEGSQQVLGASFVSGCMAIPKNEVSFIDEYCTLKSPTTINSRKACFIFCNLAALTGGLRGLEECGRCTLRSPNPGDISSRCQGLPLLYSPNMKIRASGNSFLFTSVASWIL